MGQSPEVRTMTVLEGGQNGKNVSIDCKGELDEGEALTGAVTIPAVTGLTFSNAAVNTSTLTINGRSVPAGEALTFNVKGTTAATYTITAWANTTATPSQTVDAKIKLKIVS